MNPLPHESLLTALGEVAAAFVGFSLVVSMLRVRSTGSAEETRRFYSMRDVAEIGLGAVFASFLPLVIHAFDASPDTTWRVGSACFLGLSVLGAGSSFRRRGSWVDGVRAEPIQTVMVLPLQLGSIALMAFNLVAGGPGSGARYIAAVLMMLGVAGVLFVNATFDSAED